MKDNSTVVTIHMVSSLNGLVSSVDDQLHEWMKSKYIYDLGRKLTDTDVASFLDRIDCYIIGTNTYRLTQELGWPYGEKPVFLLSQSVQSSDIKSITVWSGTPEELLNDVIPSSYKNIWIAGGPMIVSSFLKKQLADELIITIAPAVIGSGRAFFESVDQSLSLELISHEVYSDGMIELAYKIHY